MAYDPKTVLERYQQILDTPEGEPTESFCALARDGAVTHDTLGCEPGGCESCCVGMVEVVRQFSEQAASLEVRSFEFTDILTRAEKLEKAEGPATPGTAAKLEKAEGPATPGTAAKLEKAEGPATPGTAAKLEKA